MKEIKKNLYSLYMFLFIVGIWALKYYIKDYYANMYISSEEKGNQSPYFSDKAKPDLFEIAENEPGSIGNVIKVLTAKTSENLSPINPTVGDKPQYEGSVIDISPYKNTVIYYPFYSGLNQFVTLKRSDVEGKYNMVHNDKCIGYNTDDFVFELVDCLDKKVQSFALVPPQDY